MFADENGKFAWPASLIMAVHEEPSHIDYYLGISNYVSAEKETCSSKVLEQSGVGNVRNAAKVAEKSHWKFKRGFGNGCTASRTENTHKGCRKASEKRRV